MCLQVVEMTEENEKDPEDSGEEETKVWKIFYVSRGKIVKYAIPAITKNQIIWS